MRALREYVGTVCLIVYWGLIVPAVVGSVCAILIGLVVLASPVIAVGAFIYCLAWGGYAFLSHVRCKAYHEGEWEHYADEKGGKPYRYYCPVCGVDRCRVSYCRHCKRDLDYGSCRTSCHRDTSGGFC